MAASTAIIKDKSLSDLYAYDLRPRNAGGRLRFLCCIHGGDNQKSLSYNESTGWFDCHNCGAKGIVTDRQESPSESSGQRRRYEPPPLAIAQPVDVNQQAINLAANAYRAFAGSPAEEYAQRRGIRGDLAKSLRLGYHKGRLGDIVSEWLIFPLRCPLTGVAVSCYGRNLRSDDQRAKGRIYPGGKGYFGAMQKGPMPSVVVAVEGPFEAIAVMSTEGNPAARAVIGSSAKAEYFDDCESVVIAFDDDEPGQRAAERLTADLAHRRKRRECGPRVFVQQRQALRDAFDVKDLGDLLAKGIAFTFAMPTTLPPRAQHQSIEAVSRGALIESPNIAIESQPSSPATPTVEYDDDIPYPSDGDEDPFDDIPVVIADEPQPEGAPLQNWIDGLDELVRLEVQTVIDAAREGHIPPGTAFDDGAEPKVHDLARAVNRSVLDCDGGYLRPLVIKGRFAFLLRYAKAWTAINAAKATVENA